MPFYDVEDRPVTASIGVAPLEDLTVAPAAQPVNPNGPSVLGASYRQDNIIGSIMSRKDAGITFDMEDGFNPFDRIKGTKYEQRPELFTDIFNTKALSARQAQIDMEDEDRAVMARSGLKGVAASLMWQVFDPTILAPGGGVIKAARGGYSLGKSALSIGAWAAAGTALQEGILQSTQQTRPLEDSAIAIGSSLVLGGLLGGGAASLLSRSEARVADRGFRVLHQAMSGEVPAAAAGGSVAAPLADLAGRVRAGEAVTTSEIVEAARVAALQARQSSGAVERLARIDDVIEPMLKRLESETVRSSSNDLIMEAKRAFGSDASRLIDEGGVRVVQSVEDLPARPDGAAHPADVRGVYDGQTAYLVADNVAPGEVKGVLLHEVGVHYGMERMVGADNFRVLLDDITARAQAGEARFADALAAVPKDTPPQHVAEEVLAYLVENAPETGIVQRVITAVKQFVRQAFGGKFSGLSEDDIRALAVSALRKWKPDAGPAEIRYARQNRSPEVQRSLPDLVAAAKEMQSWKDWYDRYQGDLTKLFGSDAALIQKMLSATSQATSVPGNVTLALKAYRQYLAGEAFDGFLPAVRGNLERIRNDEAIRGQKIAEYGKANEGDGEGIAVDRHIAELFFDTKSPTAQQVAAAKAVIRSIATELGWDAKGVQAALWAYNIVRKGGVPQSYDTFLKAKAAEIEALRARYGRGEGEGVPDGGAVGRATGGAQEAVGDAGRVAGLAGEAADVRYSIAPEQARRLRGDVRIPTSKEFKDAIAGTPAARLVDDGVEIDIVRYQKPEQDGMGSVRTGVFYLPKGSPQERYYKTAAAGYGGKSKQEGTTLLRSPLFVKGATGGKAPEAAYDLLKGKGAYEAMRRDVLNAVMKRGSAQEEAVYEVLAKYGADPDLAYDIVANSKVGNTLAYAVQENIVAHAAREAGHDSILGYSKGKAGPFISEVFDLREVTYPERGVESEVHRDFYSRGGNRNERIASQLETLVKALDNLDDPAAFANVFAGRAAAAGAEAVDRPTLEDLSVAGAGARAYAAATKFLNPNLRANFRASVAAREYTQQLLENSVFQSMHADNRTLGSAVETMMRQEFRSRVIASARAADEIYAAGRKAGMQMTRRDFDEAVAKAMRREDIGENEFVSKAAASYRKEMFDHFKEMAQKTLGKDGKTLLPEDLQVVGAPSYLTRMPNHERLVADEMGFKETVARYYEGVFRNEYEQHANATRTRIAALEREIADLNLAPEDRAKTLADIEKRLADMETANAREIDLLSEINRYRQQAVKAGERGDKKAQKAAKEEASKLFEQGGDNLRAFLKERTALRQRQRRIDLNYAGMQEREDRIAQQIADIEERNLRAMTRLIDRGQKAEREFAKLDPSIKAEKIAALRTQFGEVAKRSEQAADRLAEQAKKVALDEIAALKRQMAERKAKEAPPKQLTKSGRAMGARPVSLVEFIRKNGGLPLDGEAKARNLKGGLATKDGKSIDGFWREKLIENGYLPKEADGGMSRDITDELFAAIDKELRGQKVYSAFDQEAVARRMGANNPDELDMLTSNVLGALEEVGIRGKEVDERALIDAAVAVAGNKALDPLDAYEQAVIKLSREAEDKPVVNVEDLVKRLRGPKMETVEKRKAALAASIQKNAVAERARSEKLNAIARRLDEAEALDPDGQALELKRALNELAAMTSGTSLDRGAKAQRLMDRAKALDPKKLDERIKTIEAMKSDIQKEFDDRWFRRRGGEGVDLENPAAKVSFRDYAEDVARQIYDHYTGRSEASGTVPDFAVPLASGPLKERTFNIPDKLIEPWLENDIRRISDRYARTMAAQIELTRKFGRADMRDQLIAITQEYRDLREQVGLAKTADEALQIVGQKKGALDSLQASLRRQDINKATKERILAWLNEDEAGAKRDLEAGRDLLLGRYKMDEARSDFARITDGLLAFNYARAMGGAVIANLGDIYRSAMVNGLGRFMSDGVKPLLTNIEGFRASVKEAQLAGQVGEKWLHQRLATFAEIGDPYSKGTALGRMMENMSRVATKWNGLALFTDFSKSLASVTTQNRLIEAVSGGKEQRWLRWAGIDGYMEGRIKEQLATHGRTIDGVRVAETTKWTDPEAVRAYRAAVSKTVDTISVERSVGDVPLFVNTPIGKLIAQFRTFNLAANQRVLLNGMQEDKARFVGSLIAMTTIGMMVATLRSWRGGEERWNKFKESATNPGFLLGEGLDNSGIFTIPFEMANTIEKLTQPSGFSFNPIKTPMMAAFPGKSQQGESSRFASRDPIGALLGPSAGLPMTLAKALGGDVKAGTQLIPFSTYPGMREAVQALTGDSPYGF